ncbi:lipocalin-like domain-containing protein [Pseudoalteromonas luteoviolacea]|uniref:lipocalin-like domain-containing protein n=1 Tax=Pseudoalteromonas luteoviolacea TaxID=43657 RepID=UPI001B3797D4|nr:lipocalin-like domain-containing protein [Pseudoalteromonas luteoviolacea]MBQ4835714.1 lipocalin-like domain-containing protein [Pseudoalteromonas luteoviolacea]
MRVLFTLVLALGLLSGCQTVSNSRQADTLEGEWQLELETLVIGDQKYTTFDGKSREMIKIFTDSHFAFSSIGNNRPRFSSFQLTKEQKVVAFDNFGGSLGRYSYEDNILTEHIEYSSFPNYEGVSIPFKITIIGDTMVQEGTYPLIELGLGEQDGYLRATFKRIK